MRVSWAWVRRDCFECSPQSSLSERPRTQESWLWLDWLGGVISPKYLFQVKFFCWLRVGLDALVFASTNGSEGLVFNQNPERKDQ